MLDVSRIVLTPADPSIGWPPPDPDRMPRVRSQYDPAEEAAFKSGYSISEIEEFRSRQRHDVKRFAASDETIRRRQVFHKRFDSSDSANVQPIEDHELDDSQEGEESWRTREGESLSDYGVDEEVEFYDEEDLPLSELAKRMHNGRTS